jgi:hypothetical protein
MLAHRIADQRILRLVRNWLDAGILESAHDHDSTALKERLAKYGLAIHEGKHA